MSHKMIKREVSTKGDYNEGTGKLHIQSLDKHDFVRDLSLYMRQSSNQRKRRRVISEYFASWNSLRTE